MNTEVRRGSNYPLRRPWCTLAEFKRASIDLEDPQNPFGQVDSVELTLSGKLMPLLPKMLETWTSNYRDAEQHHVTLEPDLFGEELVGVPLIEMEGFRMSRNIHGIILAHVQTNTYQRKGFFEVSA